MANDNDRFLFWRSYYNALVLLDDKDAGRLVKAMCAFAFEKVEADLSDSLALNLAWTMINAELRESVESGRRYAENGRRSGEARRSKNKQTRNDEHRSERRSNGVPNGDSSVSKYVSTYSDSVPFANAQERVADSREPRRQQADDYDPYAGVVVDEEEARRKAQEFMESIGMSVDSES